MAATVVANMTLIDDAESATTWSTGSLDAAKFVQGSNAVGFYMSKNNRSSVTITPSTSKAWATGDHLYFWLSSDVASKSEPQTTGTTTPSGLTVRVTLANGAYREWHVAGSDTWDGGWRCFVMDLGHTGTHLYASSGTFSSASNIASVTYYIDLSNSGNIRNVPANHYGDVIRVGTGLTAYGATAFDLADIAAEDEKVANRYGVLENIDGIIFAQGEVILGDNTGTNQCNFSSQDEKLVYLTRNGTDGFGLVSSTLYKFNAVGNATGSTDILMGVKVGTGDTATGRSGSDIIGGSGANVTVDLDDGNVNSVKLYGSKFQNLKGTVDATGLVAADEIMGTFIDGCDRLDPGAATYRNITVLNSVAIATDGAVIWASDTDIQNSSFLNNSRAVVFESSTGTPFTWTGLNFAGNTYDVRNESGTAIVINVSNGNAGTKEEASGTITINNTVNTTIKGVPTGAEWRLYDDSGVAGELGTVELAGAESHTGGDITYADNYVADNAAVLQVMASGYVEYEYYFTLGANPQTINVTLVPETNA